MTYDADVGVIGLGAMGARSRQGLRWRGKADFDLSIFKSPKLGPFGAIPCDAMAP